MGDSQKAILNILDDSSAEKLRIEATQKAILNILDDASAEKVKIEATQKAILNILDDSGAEKLRIEATQKAILNILDDIGDERDKADHLNSEMAVEIAERKRVEQELETQQQELVNSNKELEAFSYSVSHDLRAPLRAIDGYGRILTEDYEGYLDQEGRRLLSVISSETQRMGQLVDDLLTFSRLGRQQLQSSDIDMTTLAQAVFQEWSALDAYRALQLELKPLPPARGDRALISVALGNLIANAIKFTRNRDPAVIEIGSRQENGLSVYYVKDNGVGFDMKYAHKLFGVFQRLHSTEEFEGTGVGLALVQRVIHRHGGRVWAEGKLDEGATFYFSLTDMKGEL
ncbi:MAG: two-component sensor histidine kinase [Fimbriimonas ginsengisoli]|uniref:histidine kinase n=1 Tax=Fimbriimonas ginsengisoli TaxID=1005039 RepID=A0A931PV23_FIMGI|nr:two-component sensor histidine kinase [Fimbriimonas ginsengisoli]